MAEFNVDEKYMRRALQLAALGRGYTAPNPMVGAVIVAPDGRVIGEGWHRRCGQTHAEVNAVNSVADADLPLLRESTIYVTLEPCSHYGKTPPCAKLLIDKQIPRVVVGARDPNPKVDGRGIAMLRDAGAEVIVGVLADESEKLNKVFFTSQRLRRPYITLKWAQSADGFMDARRDGEHSAKHAGTRDAARDGQGKPYAFSTPLTRLAVMKLRAENEAILTTAATVNADNPLLALHGWPGIPPRRFVVERNTKADPCSAIFDEGSGAPAIILHPSTIGDTFATLYNSYGITSVLVEAGPRYLASLLEQRLWDELRVEISPVCLGDRGTCPAPALPAQCPLTDTILDGHRILLYKK